MRSRIWLVIALFAASGLYAQEVLSNESIIKMTKAGLSEDIIASMVNKQPGKYSTESADLILLKGAGVTDKVISLIMTKAAAQPVVTSPVPLQPSAPGAVNPVAPHAVSEAPARVAAPASEPLTLLDATPVRLRLSRNLSSADARTGETIDFEVLDDIKASEIVVIPHGTNATGTITQAKPKGRMAKGGKLDVTIDYVRLASGEKIALRGVKESSAGGHTGAMTGAIVVTALVAWPAAPFFLFMHGKDMTIPKGTEITAYVNGDVRLDRQKFPAK